MASRSSIRLLPAVLVAAVLAAVAGAARSPGYCVPGQAFPRSPLPHCRWYVASRSPCSLVAVPRLPVWYMKDMCCRQLGFISPECRCKALRVMMDEARQLSSSSPAAAAAPEEEEKCWAEQGDLAASVVTEAECGLSTVHGRPYCDALAAEE